MFRNAVQLYCFHNAQRESFPGLFRDIKAMGFDGVEFAGYYGYSMKDIRSFLDDAGLKAEGAHISYETLNTELDQTIEQSLALGQRYIVCPHLDPQYRENLDAVLAVAEDFSRFGEKIRNAGLTFAFHTEQYHFDFYGEKSLSEIILDETDPADVKIQLDTGNGEVTGRMKTLDFMKKYPDRCELLHIKEYIDIGDAAPAVLGDGILELAPVLAKGEELGCTWYTLEYEGEEPDVRPAVKKSFEVLLREEELYKSRHRE